MPGLATDNVVVAERCFPSHHAPKNARVFALKLVDQLLYMCRRKIHVVKCCLWRGRKPKIDFGRRIRGLGGDESDPRII